MPLETLWLVFSAPRRPLSSRRGRFPSVRYPLLSLQLRMTADGFMGLVLLGALLICSTLLLGQLLEPKAWAQSSSSTGQSSTTPTGQTVRMGVTIENEDSKHSKPFYEVLKKALKKHKTTIENICPPGDAVARRVLEEYGAIFVASNKVTPPPVCVFTSDEQVKNFQTTTGYQTELVGDEDIELQPAAMKALLKAIDEAQEEGLDITPRDGAEGARRSYSDSQRLWDTRFLPALEYWLSQQRLTSADVDRLRGLPTHSQIAEVLELEKQGIFFSKDLSKSILYSIAAPGTSQHIAMLAFDANEFDNPRVREILAKHGWFQTVLSDRPHFTYLGLKEKDLPKHGLKRVQAEGQIFWVPNVPVA